MGAAEHSGLWRQPRTSRRFSTGLSKAELHIILVDKLVADAERAALDAIGFETERSVQLLRGHLAGCNRQKDCIEIRQVFGALDQGGEKRFSDPLAARGIRDVHAPYAALMLPLESCVAEEAGGADELSSEESSEN